VAVASAAAWFASGDRMELSGSDFGRERCSYRTLRGARVVQPYEHSELRYAVGQIIIFDEITKSRELPLELQFDSARRSVALLGDNDFSLAESEIHFELPFLMFGRAELGSLFCK